MSNPAFNHQRKLTSQPAGFTLIEVVLAIAIAAGMLLVVLTFYQQAATLRGRLLEETANISAIRLVMERLSSELGAVRRNDLYQIGLSGGVDNLQLVKLDFPRAGAWTNPATAAPFRRVSYSLQGGGGLVRSEEPLWASVVVVSTNEPTAAAVTDVPSTPTAPATPATPTAPRGRSATSAGTGTKATKGTGAATTPRAASAASATRASGPASGTRATSPASGTGAAEATMASDETIAADTTMVTNATNRTNVVAASASTARRGGTAIGQAQFVRFRYWDGSSWLEAWDAPDLPIGVEVSLGMEPLPAEMTAEEYPFELYRRVVYLPNHGPARQATDLTQEGM
jgi:prepilin-type N-terminal cleavage/methylation domain-containing protein